MKGRARAGLRTKTSKVPINPIWIIARDRRRPPSAVGHPIHGSDFAELAEGPKRVGWGFLLNLVGFPLKLYSAVSCVYPALNCILPKLHTIISGRSERTDGPVDNETRTT